MARAGIAAPPAVTSGDMPPATAIQFAGITGPAQIATGRWIVVGMTVYNSGNAAGLVRLRTGDPATGALILQDEVGASSSGTPLLGLPGILAEAGLAIDVAGNVNVTGSVLAVRL